MCYIHKYFIILHINKYTHTSKTENTLDTRRVCLHVSFSSTFPSLKFYEENEKSITCYGAETLTPFGVRCRHDCTLALVVVLLLIRLRVCSVRHIHILAKHMHISPYTHDNISSSCRLTSQSAFKVEMRSL